MCNYALRGVCVKFKYVVLCRVAASQPQQQGAAQPICVVWLQAAKTLAASAAVCGGPVRGVRAVTFWCHLLHSHCTERPKFVGSAGGPEKSNMRLPGLAHDVDEPWQ